MQLNLIDTTAEWKQCPYLDDRLISNTGLIYSKRNASLLKLQLTGPIGKKYKTVGWYTGGKYKHLKVHRLVAKLFVPNPFGYNVVNHLDGDKLNNNHTNLEWTTVAGNTFHAIDTGLNKKRGADNHNAKLTDDKVAEIKSLHQNGVRQKTLASCFGLNQSTVSRLLNSKTWRAAS